MVEANERIWRAVAGSAEGVSAKCFPPSPKAIMNTIRIGIHARRSYQLSTRYPQKEI
jgi:hypothetical protein